MVSRAVFMAPAIFFSLASTVLLSVVLFSGVNNSLLQLYFMRVDVGDIQMKPALDSSQFLRDLSQVSGADFVGQTVTAESLGLPKWLGISILTDCQTFADGRTECEKPRFGFFYNPVRSFKVEGTPAQGLVSRELVDHLNRLARAMGFLSGALVVGALTGLLSPLEMLCSPQLACLSCSIGSIILFAGNVASLVLFKQVNDTWNRDLSHLGLTSKLGTYAIVLVWVAFGLMLCAAVLYGVGSSRGRAQRRRRVAAHSVGGKGHPLMGPAYSDGEYARDLPAGAVDDEPRPGLWGRTNTNNHKYVQLEKQPALGSSPGLAQQESAVFENAEGNRQRLDADWAAPDEYADAAGAAGETPKKTTSGPGGNKQTKDLNTAYEPYSNAPQV